MTENTEKLESLSYKPAVQIGSDANGANLEKPKVSNNGPNQHLMIIEEIAGLLSQANEKMYELPLHPIRSKAIEEIDLLQRTTIVELRKVFE